MFLGVGRYRVSIEGSPVWKWLRSLFNGSQEDTPASIPAERAKLEAERTRLAAERSRLEEERRALQEEQAELKAERSQFEAQQRRAAKKRGRTGQSTVDHVQSSARECKQAGNLPLDGDHSRVRGRRLTADVSDSPATAAQQSERILSNALGAHQNAIETLLADAWRRGVTVSPPVLDRLRSLQLELQQIVPSSLTVESLYQQIGGIRKQCLLLTTQERACWRTGKAVQIPQPPLPRTPQGAPPAEPAQRPTQNLDRPLSARERYLLIEDPGQGGHRDLSRDQA